jgi:DNA-binding response OmpR family regulator
LRVLLIEDEPGMVQFIQQGLQEQGFSVVTTQDGETGLEAALLSEFDALVLDIMLPKMDGLQVLKELRDRGVKTPVLLLTARSEVEDRVRGLDQGADDYLVKPFAFSELLARLRALVRRPPLQNNPVLEVGDLTMDVAAHSVHRSGRMIELSPREFTLLELFLRHPRQVLSRTQIAEQVWNLDYYTGTNVVDVYIGYLRRKIDRGFEYPLIHTVRGIGYRISTEGASDE